MTWWMIDFGGEARVSIQFASFRYELDGRDVDKGTKDATERDTYYLMDARLYHIGLKIPKYHQVIKLSLTTGAPHLPTCAIQIRAPNGEFNPIKSVVWKTPYIKRMSRRVYQRRSSQSQTLLQNT